MNYYPFGLKHKGYNNVTSSNGNAIAQKFKYNGVEFEENLGLNLYETYARGYDPATGRFMTIDPLGELIEQIDKSPYQFAWNNPVFFNDPLGLCPECQEFFPDPMDGQVYISDAGEEYIFENGNWVRSGGKLDEFDLPSSSSSNEILAGGDIEIDGNKGNILGLGAGTLLLEETIATEITVTISGAAVGTGLLYTSATAMAIMPVAFLAYLAHTGGNTVSPYMPETGPVSTLRGYEPRPNPALIDETVALLLANSAYLTADFAKGGEQNIWPDDYPFPDISNIDWGMGDADFATSVTGSNPPGGKGPKSPWNRIKKWFRDKKAKLRGKK